MRVRIASAKYKQKKGVKAKREEMTMTHTSTIATTNYFQIKVFVKQVRTFCRNRFVQKSENFGKKKN